ncbi:glycosyl transferase [Kockovaella imperatae]|uniref:Glycosyl transferase n=1 Tax=Kockovaella imperatae TaxID=4999 RepID=A0A1Y1UPH5_9TREE|nr:glycosyl transferase [Kockovaella imperatae]ORX39366.1 glycosyl transferase [Kockovaella imperatae]
MSYRLLERDEAPDPLLPTSSTPTRTTKTLPKWARLLPRGRSRSRWIILALTALFVLAVLNHRALGTWRRDFVYLIRPLWDTPEPPFHIIPHYASPTADDTTGWCALHGWTPRPTDPRTGHGQVKIVDAVLLSSELDMLEIRMREYLPYVTTFVIVEADRTFSGEPKPLYFDQNRFNTIIKGCPGTTIEYHVIRDLQPDQPVGSFDNEIKMRRAVSEVLASLDLPAGSLVIQSDVDEIISWQTLDLLTTCQGFPQTLHLNVKNYRYDFAHPIPDEGYWRPHVYTTQTDHEGVGYYHGRGSNELLAGAGWHCSFCFATLDEMRAKMRGYSHNDRLRDPSLLDTLRSRVCDGRDPFNMWPEAFTFKDIFAQSGRLAKSLVYTDTPSAVQEFPERFAYLLDKGCERPES